jgi:hypothetical protein
MKDLLMVVEKEYLDGINNGWYDKSVTNDVKRRVEFVDQDDIVNSNITLHTVPTYRGKDLYIKDSHSNVYVSMDDDNIEKLFITSQCNAVKEALVRMGAKRITIKKTVKDVEKEETAVNGNAKHAIVKGEVRVGWDKSTSINLQGMISSEDPNRKPKPFADVMAFINEHGLANDTFLTGLADRLKCDERLSGKEEMTVNWLCELKSSWNFAVDIKAKLVNAHADAMHKKEHIHEFTSVIEVDFG